jgi:hypothetical protein
MLLITAVQANAGFIYRTTLTLSNPDLPPPTVQLTRAVFDWETTLMSGTAINTDLVSLTMRLFDGNSLVYTDQMVAGGVAQSIGGAARTIDNIAWNFDIDSLLLINFDNDFLSVEAGAATGQTYNAYTLAFGQDKFQVLPYLDGMPGDANTWDLVENTEAVPVAPTALLVLAGLPLLGRRRNTAANRGAATA